MTTFKGVIKGVILSHNESLAKREQKRQTASILKVVLLNDTVELIVEMSSKLEPYPALQRPCANETDCVQL